MQLLYNGQRVRKNARYNLGALNEVKIKAELHRLFPADAGSGGPSPQPVTPRGILEELR
jgi:hypothetical protein